MIYSILCHGIRFDEVDFSGRDLPEQFRERLEGFYLRPPSQCADAGAAFNAGVRVPACIDALARIQIGEAVEAIGSLIAVLRADHAEDFRYQG